MEMEEEYYVQGTIDLDDLDELQVFKNEVCSICQDCNADINDLKRCITDWD